MEHIADRLIVPHTQRKKMLYRKGDTDDIITVVLKVLEENRQDTGDFAREFTPDFSGMEELWHFVKENIRYREDPDGVQWIQTPAYLWHHTRRGDCKSFTVFIASVLHHLGIPYLIRFVSYDRSKVPSHVYPIAFIQNSPVIMDAVYIDFNLEKPYRSAIDFADKKYIK
jgi:hypothetical protein